MDGIKTRILTCRQARVLTVVVLTVASALVAVPAGGENPDSSHRRHSLNRFVGTGFELNSVSPARIRPPARVIDARQSPVVAVKSASDRLPTVEEALKLRGSVTFRKTPISEVVFLLSDLWKINIVAGADVSGDVSGAFQNAPLSEVLSAALTASGYGYRQIGNSLVVLPIDQIGTATSVSAGTGAFSESGIAYYSPQFTDAEQMAEPLQVALGESVVVAVYPEENRIMIKGSPEDLRIASEAIQQLDVPRPQVRITAMIYDVSLGELERLGVNWNRQVRELANGDNDALTEVTRSVSELFLGSSELTTTGATSIGIRTISNSLNASVFLEALDATSEAKLLADPSITVSDRTEASIRIVQQIPIVGANPVEGSNAVFTQTEFKEAGVILKVLPRISRDGTIQLLVQPEYSVVSEMTAAGPVIDTRTADTVVRVNDGQMFVLGGLRQKSIVESVRGVPYLKEMKHLGKLFRSHSTEVRESELIVFLKPELITPYYVGHPRETMAACVASDQLDRIPHAQTASMIPCCKDPYCANHHPRPRPNLGSYSLEMFGGVGMETNQIITSESFEATGEPVFITPQAVESESFQSAPAEQAPIDPALIEPIPLSNPDLSYSDVEISSSTLEPTVVEELYPVGVNRIAGDATE
jgi:type II secretory pathway component GspD/PulD (secretin)